MFLLAFNLALILDMLGLKVLPTIIFILTIVILPCLDFVIYVYALEAVDSMIPDDRQDTFILNIRDTEYRVHRLKTWPKYYNAIESKDKTKKKYLDLRYDDRGYRVGDYLLLEEYDPETRQYTGRYEWRLVTHIVKNVAHLTEGYVAMSLLDKRPGIEEGLYLSELIINKLTDTEKK